jgi:ethanolamine utilization protein EutQ (cupin superfamily)
MYKIELDNLPWESPMEGIRHKRIVIGDMIIRHVEYSKLTPFHWCEKGHIGYVINGELEIQFNNERQKYKSGDCIIIPDGPDHKHAGKVLSNTVNIFFIEKL